MNRVHLHRNALLEERKLIVENHMLQKKLKKQSDMQARINSLMDIIISQKSTIETLKSQVEELQNQLISQKLNAK